MGSPSRVTRPLVGESRAARMLSRVVFPEPEAPAIATSSPGATAIETESRATTSEPGWEKTRQTSRASRMLMHHRRGST